MKLLIVGCGNMGGAMLAGWLAAGLDPGSFTVVDPVLEQVPAGVTLLLDIPHGQFDAVLLGVKPQTLDAVAPALAPLVDGQTVLLSILAGAELASLSARFPQAGAIIRVMPNLAAAIGKSPVALFGERISDDVRGQVTGLMASLGQVEWLESESQLDMVTALAGSGPAFVYRFIEALAAGAEGLAPDQALRLAQAMVEGAAALAAAADESPRELARRVTSPGGTTEAGLAVLDAEQSLTKLVSATLRAARDRGADLARAAR